MRIIIFKFLFAYLGFQIARFVGDNELLGTLTGLFFGHLLDLLATHKFHAWRFKRHQQKQAEIAFQHEFVGSLFFMFGKICGCDGAIVREEISAVEDIMTNVFNLSKAGKKDAITAFRNARTSSESFQSNAVRFYEFYREHPEVLEGIIQMFMRLAAADGVLKHEEDQLIQCASSVFGIDQTRYQQLRIPFLNGKAEVSDLEKCYAVLGCAKNATDLQIKSCYRKLATRYHPDTIVAKDLPEEFIQFANRKMQDIQDAYETLKAERGFS